MLRYNHIIPELICQYAFYNMSRIMRSLSRIGSGSRMVSQKQNQANTKQDLPTVYNLPWEGLIPIGYHLSIRICILIPLFK